MIDAKSMNIIATTAVNSVKSNNYPGSNHPNYDKVVQYWFLKRKDQIEKKILGAAHGGEFSVVVPLYDMVQDVGLEEDRLLQLLLDWMKENGFNVGRTDNCVSAYDAEISW